MYVCINSTDLNPALTLFKSSSIPNSTHTGRLCGEKTLKIASPLAEQNTGADEIVFIVAFSPVIF